METNVKIEFAIGKNDWLRINLEDLICSLNKQFEKKHVESKVSGILHTGIFTVIVKNSSIEFLKPYIDAFVKSQRKGDETFIYNISEIKENIDEAENFDRQSLRNSRKKYLNKVVLTGQSLKDAIKKKST